MTHNEYMTKALALAQKAKEMQEVPVGAIIVKDNKIISSAHNLCENENSSILHAEIIAIKKAQEILGQKFLSNCTLYVTLEPCSMCAGAIINSRISHLVYGADDFKQGAFGGMYNILSLNVNHTPLVTAGILWQECSEILSDFFKDLRK